MRQIIIAALALLPLGVSGQDNSWEQPEEEEQVAVVKAKENPDAKYLRGAVPVVDGKVEFNKHIDAPGKNASQIYAIVKQYIQKMTQEKNQLNSRIAIDDTLHSTITATFEEWLVFKSKTLWLDRTRFMYALQVKCTDGGAEVTLTHLRYLYDEERTAQRFTAEEWITDDEAVNKKNTRLQPISGKFRRKTIDRKDYLFNKFESLLK